MNQNPLHKELMFLGALHDKAMVLAEEAFFLKRKKDNVGALNKYNEAFKIEKQVANILLDVPEDKSYGIEPSRSVLVLSAAALARDAGNLIEMDYYASKVIQLNYDGYFVKEALSLKSSPIHEITF